LLEAAGEVDALVLASRRVNICPPLTRASLLSSVPAGYPLKAGH
jgi:hypothetical protein